MPYMKKSATEGTMNKLVHAVDWDNPGETMCGKALEGRVFAAPAVLDSPAIPLQHVCPTCLQGSWVALELAAA